MPTPRHQLDACGRWAGDVGRPPSSSACRCLGDGAVFARGKVWASCCWAPAVWYQLAFLATFLRSVPPYRSMAVLAMAVVVGCWVQRALPCNQPGAIASSTLPRSSTSCRGC